MELAPSRASLCSSVEAAMMDDANGSSNGVLTGGDLSVNKDSRLRFVKIGDFLIMEVLIMDELRGSRLCVVEGVACGIIGSRKTVQK